MELNKYKTKKVKGIFQGGDYIRVINKSKFKNEYINT